MRVSVVIRFLQRAFLAFAASSLLSSCASLGWFSEPTKEEKQACGRQCLKNGEGCSQFFAQKNEKQRRDFEQAKENYWICLRKFPGAESRPDGPCLPPPPPAEAFDSCGPELDECLQGCQTTLDELAQDAESPSPTPAPAPGESAEGQP